MPIPMRIPSIYEEGYARAKRLAPDLADEYMRHVSRGDPAADAAAAALAGFEPSQGHRFIRAGMNGEAKEFAAAPPALREMFEQAEKVPDWWDASSVHAGCRAFHTNPDLFIPAFFVVTLRNAATLISKAFYATGRVRTVHGLRRIRQNTRHFIEIMLPGALEREGDGWKLSVRIRLVHAQVRHLLRNSGEWDPAVFGDPLSAAHMGLSSANFSASLLQEAHRLGAALDEETRTAFMQIWRYASWLVGTPNELLFEGDESATLAFRDVAVACEPLPGEEASTIAQQLVMALPLVAGIDEPSKQREFRDHSFRVSRALLGDELSDQLGFPKMATAGLLRWMRVKRRMHDTLHRAVPTVASRWQGDQFMFLMDAALIDDLSYKLPDKLKAEVASPW